MQHSRYETTARVNNGQYQGYSSLRNTAGGGKPAELVIPSMATQIIPVYKNFGYSSLTHVVDSSDGVNYFNVTQAYPQKHCVDYEYRICDGQLKNQEQPKKIVVEGYIQSQRYKDPGCPTTHPYSDGSKCLSDW